MSLLVPQAGKAAVHSAAAGILPQHILPIALDVGCDTPAIRSGSFYCGLKQVGCPGAASCSVRTPPGAVGCSLLALAGLWSSRKHARREAWGNPAGDACWRSKSDFAHCSTIFGVLVQERVRGGDYDALVDEVVAALRSRYGASLLLHWEDFAAANAFRLLAKYQAQARSTPAPYPVCRRRSKRRIPTSTGSFSCGACSAYSSFVQICLAPAAGIHVTPAQQLKGGQT